MAKLVNALDICGNKDKPPVLAAISGRRTGKRLYPGAQARVNTGLPGTRANAEHRGRTCCEVRSKGGATPRDEQRREWLSNAMRRAGFDAVIAALPADVLLLTGYFPVVGTSVAVATRDSRALVIVPEDERDLATTGGADEIVTFQPASLDRLTSAASAITEPLREVGRQLGINGKVIGVESGESYEPSSYASLHLYGTILDGALTTATRKPATEFLERMKATLTSMELDRVKRSCRITSLAFQEGSESLAEGIEETAAAGAFRLPLSASGVGFDGAARADGYAFCMAGANSAEAFGAYARSRRSRITTGDFVLTHCNSHADGYWTDITRTYCIGPADERQRRMYEAVFTARQAALDAIRPGVKGCDVDRAARNVMRSYGFENNFKHATGHGVGFSAIDHNALPRLHPASEDRLQTGMVFNVEPAAYVKGYGGVRHCDMVAVTSTGSEVLTPWHCVFQDLIR